jgi:hypothetical protein
MALTTKDDREEYTYEEVEEEMEEIWKEMVKLAIQFGMAGANRTDAIILTRQLKAIYKSGMETIDIATEKKGILTAKEMKMELVKCVTKATEVMGILEGWIGELEDIGKLYNNSCTVYHQYLQQSGRELQTKVIKASMVTRPALINYPIMRRNYNTEIRNKHIFIAKIRYLGGESMMMKYSREEIEQMHKSVEFTAETKELVVQWTRENSELLNQINSMKEVALFTTRMEIAFFIKSDRISNIRVDKALRKVYDNLDRENLELARRSVKDANDELRRLETDNTENGWTNIKSKTKGRQVQEEATAEMSDEGEVYGGFKSMRDMEDRPTEGEGSQESDQSFDYANWGDSPPPLEPASSRSNSRSKSKGERERNKSSRRDSSKKETSTSNTGTPSDNEDRHKRRRSLEHDRESSSESEREDSRFSRARDTHHRPTTGMGLDGESGTKMRYPFTHGVKIQELSKDQRAFIIKANDNWEYGVVKGVLINCKVETGTQRKLWPTMNESILPLLTESSKRIQARSDVNPT